MHSALQKLLNYRLNYNKLCAYIIGFGVALFPIHNTWLTKLVTNSNNEVGFFIPAFGTAIWFIGTIMYAVNNWRTLSLGSKYIYIPLIIIVISIGLSGITKDSLGDKISPITIALCLFLLYVASRSLGKAIFYPMAIGTGISALGVVASAILQPGQITGGLVFEHNYDIVIGYMMIGLIMFQNRWQWLLAGIVTIAILLSGSPEGLFALAIFGIVVIYKRDMSKKLLIVLAMVLLVECVWLGLGWGQKLYGYSTNIATKYDVTEPFVENDEQTNRSPIGYRIWVIKNGFIDIKVFGDGYNLTGFYTGIMHNVPLIILQQLGIVGILAVLAWLWVALYCLVKTKWRYAWIVLLSLCVFDHYMWTQLAPVWWMMIGVSTASLIDSDLIFKEIPIISRTNDININAHERCRYLKEYWNKLDK